MAIGTKVPVHEAKKIQPVRQSPVVIPLTKQILEFCGDRTYAHFDEYYDRLIRDAGAMIEEIEQSRKFEANLRRFLTYKQEKNEAILPDEILIHLPKEET